MLKVPLKSLGLRGLERRPCRQRRYVLSIYRLVSRINLVAMRTPMRPRPDSLTNRPLTGNAPARNATTAQKGGCAIRDRRQAIGCECRSALLRRDGRNALPLVHLDTSNEL